MTVRGVWRWTKRIALGLVVLLLMVVAVAVVRDLGIRSDGRAAMAATAARLDREDPNWRWDDLVASRPAVPDEQNGALVVAEFAAALPARPDFPRYPYQPGRGLAPNQSVSRDQHIELIAVCGLYATALPRLDALRHCPSGRAPTVAQPASLEIVKPEPAPAVYARSMLTAEVERLLSSDEVEAAFATASLTLGVARGADEPLLVPQLTRMATCRIAAAQLERVLGHGEVEANLAPIQAELLAEADQPRALRALRGERAFIVAHLMRVDAGEPHDLGREIREEREWFGENWAVCNRAAKAAALSADYLSEGIAACAKPYHEWPTAETPRLGDDAYERVLTSGADFMRGKLLDADRRAAATLRCAAVGVALERCRQRTGAWPAALADIPRDILAAVPADPFDGQPLRYTRRADGVTVESGGAAEWNVKTTEGQYSGLFRLYDPEARALAR